MFYGWRMGRMKDGLFSMDEGWRGWVMRHLVRGLKNDGNKER